MIAVGSNFRVSTVDRAVTPKPCTLSVVVRNLANFSHQWYIVHAVHYHSLVFWRVFCYAAQMRFEHMVAV